MSTAMASTHPAIVAAVALALSAAPAPALSQHADHGAPHAPAGGPGAVKIEFENDAVVVLRLRMAPHEKTPMHDIVGSRVVIWLTDTHLRDTAADGHSTEIHRSAGAVDWVPAQRHAGENLAGTPIEWLAIVPKTTAPRP